VAATLGPAAHFSHNLPPGGNIFSRLGFSTTLTTDLTPRGMGVGPISSARSGSAETVAKVSFLEAMVLVCASSCPRQWGSFSCNTMADAVPVRRYDLFVQASRLLQRYRQLTPELRPIGLEVALAIQYHRAQAGSGSLLPWVGSPPRITLAASGPAHLRPVLQQNPSSFADLARNRRAFGVASVQPGGKRFDPAPGPKQSGRETGGTALAQSLQQPGRDRLSCFGGPPVAGRALFGRRPGSLSFPPL
jgi:hypothetical protein